MQDPNERFIEVTSLGRKSTCDLAAVERVCLSPDDDTMPGSITLWSSEGSFGRGYLVDVPPGQSLHDTHERILRLWRATRVSDTPDDLPMKGFDLESQAVLHEERMQLCADLLYIPLGLVVEDALIFGISQGCRETYRVRSVRDTGRFRATLHLEAVSSPGSDHVHEGWLSTCVAMVTKVL